MRRKILRVVTAVPLLLALAFTASDAVWAGEEGQFVHRTSQANIYASYTIIDNSLTNNNPGAILFTTFILTVLGCLLFVTSEAYAQPITVPGTSGRD